MKTFLKLTLVIFACLLIYNYFPEKKLSGVTIDKILVLKSERKMTVFSKGKEIKTYKIALGDSPIGHKQFKDDEKTPEGIYYISDKNLNSGYHLNLGISYPNDADRKFAKSQGKSTGGDIKIHALKNGYYGYINKFHRLDDWTNGCIAVTNSEIEELYECVPIGTPIEIRP